MKPGAFPRRMKWPDRGVASVFKFKSRQYTRPTESVKEGRQRGREDPVSLGCFTGTSGWGNVVVGSEAHHSGELWLPQRLNFEPMVGKS